LAAWTRAAAAIAECLADRAVATTIACVKGHLRETSRSETASQRAAERTAATSWARRGESAKERRGGGGKGDEFPKVCGATVEGVGQVAKVSGAIVDVTVEPDAVLIPATQGVLEDREEASGARNGEGHGAELAQQLVPLRDGHALAGWAELVE
jgi:hypothetical protein